MTGLLAFATGGRPLTSGIMQKALHMATREVDRSQLEIVGVRWQNDTAVRTPFRVICEPNCHAGRAYNLALRHFTLRHGELPEFFFTMDDDALVGTQTLDRMRAILDADHRIGLLGAWNDMSERGRGLVEVVQHRLGEDMVQTDRGGAPFCVGGALHAIPRRALERMAAEVIPAGAPVKPGDVYLEEVRREDEALGRRIAHLGMTTAIALTVPVGLLPDDGVDPEYRTRINALTVGTYL